VAAPGISMPQSTAAALNLPDDTSSRRIRRTLDIVLASLALVALLPLLILIAIAIRIDSPGSIFYTQERVGLDRRRKDRGSRAGDRRNERGYGRPFQVYKFRSMVMDAEKHTGAVWAVDGDPRATRVGAILRRTPLDELPQFINVLRGEMSIVGPRPERPQLVRKLVAEIPDYALRSRVLPGITGLAQLKNGYDDSVESATRKVRYDLRYMRDRNVVLDLKIMVATAGVLVRGKEDARSAPERETQSLEA